ncbi:MAG: hypothetical protein ACOCWA_09415 [Bacteroidota bacterium]
MKKKLLIPTLLLLVIGLTTNFNSLKAQSGITIDASQQITNFVFSDGSGVQDNTYLIFGEENLYKPVYSGAYSVGYSYLLNFGMFIRASAGMRNAGATMVYDAVNYQWNLKYLQGKLGIGYALSLGRVNPYFGVSGYYGQLVKAQQVINNEDFDIIDSGDIQSNDYGLYISPGVRIDASEYISVYGELGYSMGLQNIETADNGQEASNLAYMLTLGLSFTIK